MEDVALAQPYYLDITDGLAFKRAFGRKSVMLGFLNEVFKGKYKFCDLYFSDPSILLPPWENQKNVLLVRGIDDAGRKHYLEVLNADTAAFEWAATGYWFREYKSILDDIEEQDIEDKDIEDKDIEEQDIEKTDKVVISLVVLANFDRGKSRDRMRSEGLMGGNIAMSIGPDVAEQMSDIIVFDTTKAPQTLSECKDDLERLFCVSRLMVESGEEIVDSSLPEWICQIMRKAAYASLMPDEIFRYMTSEDDHHYRQIELEGARNERKDRYQEEGKGMSVNCGVKKGKNEATEDIAKKMVANEIDMKLISYCTGLSPAAIKML